MNNRFTIVNKFVRNRLVADFILPIFATLITERLSDGTVIITTREGQSASARAT